MEITDGQAMIEGDMEYEEAEQLASTIRIGGLSVELEELRSNVVGAQLGEEAISTSLIAGAIGLAIVFDIHVRSIPASGTGIQPGSGDLHRIDLGAAQCI